MAFKMRSGNKPAFKSIGSSPMKQDDDITLYSDLNEDQINAAREWNMKTYGTHNPTKVAASMGVTKDELAEFHAKSLKAKSLYEEKNVDATEHVITEEELESGNVSKEKINTTKDESPRFRFLSDERIADIKAKELKRKERKAKYKPGTSELVERTNLPHDKAFYDEQRKKQRYQFLNDTEIQARLDKEAERKERKSKYKSGHSSDKK